MNASSSAVIGPKIDVYGKAGYTAALADYIEFCAIKGKTHSAADLADVVKDNHWTRKPLRYIRMAEDLVPIASHDTDADEPEADSPDSLADQAFALISQRVDVLGDRYPFEVVHGRVRFKTGCDLKQSPYIALLAITIAHAWEIPCQVTPEAAFEFVVSSALNKARDGSRPWLTAIGMGTAERQGRNFKDALADAAGALGLTAMSNPVPVKIAGKDAGADTIVGLVWNDGRPGNWVFIGQATCGMTDTWSTKIAEPKAGHWRAYLQEPLSPQRFLAVPHHVDDRFMFWLHKGDDGLVLDRLRLVLAIDTVVADAASVVDAVLLAGAA